jgi:hypothetical protein
LVSVKTTGSYVFFGIYYGLLTTLPIGSCQILCIRAFLTGGNLSGIVALSGSMMGQLLLSLSLYCSPLYILVSKPHLLTIIVVPYMFFFWFKTKDLDNYKDLRPAISLRDPRMVRLFVNSFLFQLVNPVLLPSPVLARQIHIILFRWSNNGIFIISSLLGWMMGQLIFSSLSRLFIARIERDSPMVHLFFKRGIHATFSIITIIHVICCLGRAPISFCTKKYNNDFIEKDLEFHNFENTDIIWWIFKPWPISFFDLERSNQPTRFKRISRINGNSFVKTKVSNYFFGKCLTDGKQRLCFAALPGLSILDN